MARSTTLARVTIALFITAIAAPAPLLAQEGEPAPAPCADDIHSAFDFWIGDWEVANAEGEVVGHNAIRRIAGRCGLAESWRGAGGSTGESLNFYEPADGLWHQLWVGQGGMILRLEGGPYDDGMRMLGRASGADRPALHRITWTPLDDGRVRQHWEVSADGGESWRQVFDGYYSRVDADAGTH